MRTKGDARGFTLIELGMVIVIAVLIAMIMVPAMKKRWNADGLSQSLNNVRQIMAACSAYRADNLGRTPMRGTSYSQGQITGGWDTWHFGGKNCDSFWQSNQGGVFDEKAFFRPLNRYISNIRIPTPIGAINTGSGSTWTLSQGVITAQVRAALQLPVFRSPGDVGSRQRSVGVSTVTAYNDVGTSYFVNMKWWNQAGWPSNFTARFNAGTEQIRNIIPGQEPDGPFAWVHDQTADVVFNAPNSNFVMKGEFGNLNRSVMGFLTGEAAYVRVYPQVLIGPNYTFGLHP